MEYLSMWNNKEKGIIAILYNIWGKIFESFYYTYLSMSVLNIYWMNCYYY